MKKLPMNLDGRYHTPYADISLLYELKEKGYTLAQISEITGRSTGDISSRLRRYIQTIQENSNE